MVLVAQLLLEILVVLDYQGYRVLLPVLVVLIFQICLEAPASPVFRLVLVDLVLLEAHLYLVVLAARMALVVLLLLSILGDPRSQVCQDILLSLENL